MCPVKRDAHRFVEIAFHSRVKESLDPMAIDPLPLCSACVVAVAIEVNGFLPIGTYRHDLLQFLTIQIHEPTNKSQSNPTRIFPRKTGSDSGLCASTFPYAIIYIVFGCSLFSPFGHSLYMWVYCRTARPEIPTGRQAGRQDDLLGRVQVTKEETSKYVWTASSWKGMGGRDFHSSSFLVSVVQNICFCFRHSEIVGQDGHRTLGERSPCKSWEWKFRKWLASTYTIASREERERDGTETRMIICILVCN